MTTTPQKHHTIPADVLPSASEDLFILRNNGNYIIIECDGECSVSIVCVLFHKSREMETRAIAYVCDAELMPFVVAS